MLQVYNNMQCLTSILSHIFQAGSSHPWHGAEFDHSTCVTEAVGCLHAARFCGVLKGQVRTGEGGG